MRPRLHIARSHKLLNQSNDKVLKHTQKKPHIVNMVFLSMMNTAASNRDAVTVRSKFISSESAPQNRRLLHTI